MSQKNKLTRKEIEKETNKAGKLAKEYKFHYNPEAWEKDFRKFLKTKYLPFCFKKPLRESDKELINQMVSKKYFDTWIALVTHSTYNPNVRGNSERTEHYGDRGQAQKLSYLVYVKHPEFTEDDVSNIQNKYLSKKQQAQWSVELGIPKFFRGFIEMTIDIQEDLFEAVYGGIHIIGNKINPGLGEILGQNFMFNMFKDIDLGPTLKDPKTRFKDIIETKMWSDGPNFKENYSANPRGNKQVHYTLYLPEKAVLEINKNKEKNMRPISPKIVEKTVNIKADRKEVLKQMYVEALNVLEKYGYNREKILEERKDVQVTGELKDRLDQKMANEKLSNIRMTTYKHKLQQKKTIFIYQLVAYDEELEEDIILYSAKVNLGRSKISGKDLYKILVKEFLNGEKGLKAEDRDMIRPIIREFTVE